MFWIYTQPDCIFCFRAKGLLDDRKLTYTEIDVNEPGVKDFFRENGFKTVPQIYEKHHHIGGFNELLPYLEDNFL